MNKKTQGIIDTIIGLSILFFMIFLMISIGIFVLNIWGIVPEWLPLKITGTITFISLFVILFFKLAEFIDELKED